MPFKGLKEDIFGGVAFLKLLFTKIETVPAVVFEVARSGKPSPLKSAETIPVQAPSAFKSIFEKNEFVRGDPGTFEFSNMATLFVEWMFAVAASGKPSPSKSPTTTRIG